MNALQEILKKWEKPIFSREDGSKYFRIEIRQTALILKSITSSQMI